MIQQSIIQSNHKLTLKKHIASAFCVVVAELNKRISKTTSLVYYIDIKVYRV